MIEVYNRNKEVLESFFIGNDILLINFIQIVKLGDLFGFEYQFCYQLWFELCFFFLVCEMEIYYLFLRGCCDGDIYVNVFIIVFRIE